MGAGSLFSRILFSGQTWKGEAADDDLEEGRKWKTRKRRWEPTWVTHVSISSTNTMEEGREGGREGGENYTHNNAHNIALGKSRPSGQVREKERSSYYSSLPYIFLFSLPVFGIRLKVTGCFKKAGSAQSST